MLTLEYLKANLSYDPDTGLFTRIAPGKNVRVGEIAGGKMLSGHWSISLKNRRYFAHRLAWLYHYGEWPAGVIDHINGDPADNRIINLRDVTQLENTQNVRKASKNSKTGFMGVTKTDKKFEARIMASRKLYILGRYDTPEEAYGVYLAKKRELHSGCTI